MKTAQDSLLLDMMRINKSKQNRFLLERVFVIASPLRRLIAMYSDVLSWNAMLTDGMDGQGVYCSHACMLF